MLSNLAIRRATEDIIALCEESEHFGIETAELECFLGILGLPRVNLTVASSAEDAFAVGAERDTEHRLAVSIVGFFQLTVAGVEKTRGFVPAGGSEVRAIGTKRKSHHPVGVLFDAAFLLSISDVEDADGIVRSPYNQPFSIGTEREREQKVGGSGECSDNCAVIRIDQFRFAKTAWRAPGDRKH